MYKSFRIIAVDLDDVLFDFLGHFFKWQNFKYGTTLKPADMVYSTIWEAWEEQRKRPLKEFPHSSTRLK